MSNLSQDKKRETYTSRYFAPSPYALYIHIPFCIQKCNYCDFASWTFDQDSSVLKEYVRATIDRLAEFKKLGLLEGLHTCYIGGGTPSVLGENLLELCDYISHLATFDEWTVEANPDSLSEYLLDNLYQYGVTRLSIGVQSFNNDELKTLGRIHSSEHAQVVIARALSLPYQVSLDLMCAFPLQTLNSWEHTLQIATNLNPHHVSVYPLQIEDHTVFGKMLERGEIEDNNDATEAKFMSVASEHLEIHGYIRYEVASYSKHNIKGVTCASMHNCSYWTGKSYLGVGLSAASLLTPLQYDKLRTVVVKLPPTSLDTGRIRLKMTGTIDEFIEANSLCDLSYDVEFLTYKQLIAEDMMLASRMSRGISPELIAEASITLGTHKVKHSIQRAIEKGLASYDEHGFLKPTERGWLMGNELYGIFWELADQSTQWYAV